MGERLRKFILITTGNEAHTKPVNMANSKTWSERILNAASKESSIDNRTLRVRFRIPKTEMNQEEYNNVIGRTTRHLAESNMLKRVDRGVYTITKKGRKAVGA